MAYEPSSPKLSPRLPDLDEIYTHIVTTNGDYTAAGNHLLGPPPAAAPDINQLFSRLTINDREETLPPSTLPLFPAGCNSRFHGGALPCCSDCDQYGGYVYHPPTGTIERDIERDHIRTGPRMNNVMRRHESQRKEEYEFKRLKRMIETGDSTEIRRVVAETWDQLHELMVHKYGNGVVEALFRKCHQDYVNDLLLSVIGEEERFIAVCLDGVGYRCVVSLLERLRSPESKTLVASVISRHVTRLTCNFNGHNVLLQCFTSLSRTDNEAIIIRRIAENSVGIAMDQAGCCVLQNYINFAQREAREMLVAPLISEAVTLSQHYYGNYVIQYILTLQVPHITTRINQQLGRNYVRLSMDKFGSNVVEKCLLCGNTEVVDEIISEFIRSRHFTKLVTNLYGNYVIQTALQQAEGRTYILLIQAIQRYHSILKEHPNGKWVIESLKYTNNYAKCHV